MKRWILGVMMFAATFVGASATTGGHVNTDAIIRLVRSYRTEPGFTVVSVGKFGLTLAKMLMYANVQTEEEKAAIALLNNLDRVIVVSYDEAFDSRKEAFNAKLKRAFADAEKIVEVKEDGNCVNIYGTSADDGESIDDLMIFIPEDNVLVCAFGSVSLDRIADLVTVANE